MTAASPPTTVSFVSGKGGVGKTMLAVAFAREIGHTNRTLVVDLDFFNRGLTGLMREGRFVAKVAMPSFLVGSADGSEWSLVEIAENLFHVSYPHLTQRQMQYFEELSVHELRDSLQEWVHTLAAQCGAQFVVLDCHGGPDNSSFAACLLSQVTLLVSEPDRVTFFGTLNFLRTLQTIEGGENVDIRLVFNKVIPAFSGFFLESFYNRAIRKHVSGRPLAAIFPLEVYLTKAFERTPFLSTAYPDSLLARKTRLLIYDLYHERSSAERRDHLRSSPRLHEGIRRMGRMERLMVRYSLGKPFALLDRDLIIGAMVFVVISMFVLEALWKVLLTPEVARMRNSFERVAVHVQAAVAPSREGRSFVSCARNDLRIEECLTSLQLPNNLGQRGAVMELAGRALFGRSMGSFYYYYSDKELLFARAKAIELWGPYLLGGDPPDHAQSLLRGLLEMGLEKGFGQNLSDFLAPGGSLVDALTDAYLLLKRVGVEDVLLMVLGAWFVAALLIGWSKTLLRGITLDAVLRQYGRLLLSAGLLQLLWALPLFALGGTLSRLNESERALESVELGVLAVTSLICLVLALGQARRIHDDIRFERRMLASAVRLAILAASGAIFLLGYMGAFWALVD